MRWEIWLIVALGLIAVWLLAMVAPSAARYWKIKRM